MSRRSVFVGIVAVVFVGLGAGALGWYAMKTFPRETVSPKNVSTTSLVTVPDAQKDLSENVQTTQSNESIVSGNSWEEIQKRIDAEYPDAEHITKGQIQWHDPVDAGDLGWTDKALVTAFPGTKKVKNLATGKMEDFVSTGVKYIETGNVVEGKYAGWKVMIFFSTASSSGFGPGAVMSAHLALAGPSERQFLLSGEELDSREFIKSDLASYVKGAVFDEKIVIDELVAYPKELRGRTDREVFVREASYSGDFFLETTKLTKIFTDAVFGTVWMGEKEVKYPETESDARVHAFNNFPYFDPEGKKVDNQSGDVQGGGVYLRRPDGLAVVYRQKFDIFDVFDRVGVLQAIWNDGTVNADQYEEYPSGCGMVSYVYDVTDTVNLDTDAVVVGKTKQGDVLYGFKDTTHPEFQKLYKDIYWVEAGKKKVSPEMFLKEYPEVFWKNTFGRTLAFYNTKFISPAECGKPVIYLYPQKTTDVSVKVFPSGFTKTDPEYGDGWNVSAEPNGTLTNKADGKMYPYLFWEGYSDTFLQKSERGFVVARENLKVFLDEKLAKQGLVQKEIADFEEFWLPKMQAENRSYYFVTFLPKSQIDALAPLRIDPKPDTVIRVMMDYRGLDAPESIVPQTFVTPKRTGFVAVEWGGMLRE